VNPGDLGTHGGVPLQSDRTGVLLVSGSAIRTPWRLGLRRFAASRFAQDALRPLRFAQDALRPLALLKTLCGLSLCSRRFAASRFAQDALRPEAGGRRPPESVVWQRAVGTVLLQLTYPHCLCLCVNRSLREDAETQRRKRQVLENGGGESGDP